MTQKIVLLIVFSINFISAFSFNFENYLKKHTKDSNEIFLAQFPYSEYLSTYQIDNFSTIEKHRKQIFKINKNGDDFIYKIFEQYIKSFNFNSDSLIQLTSLIQTGIIYLNTNTVITDSTYIYVDIGDYILQKSVYFIEEEIRNNNLSVSNSQVKFLINKLEQNKFMVKYDMSDYDKIILHFKKGNWSYLWKKFKSRCHDNKYLCAGIAIILILISVIFIQKLKKRNV